MRAHNHAELHATLEVHGKQVDLQLRMGLRELTHIVNVDGDGDGRLRAEEVEAVRADAERTLLASLKLALLPQTQTCAGRLAGFRLHDFSSINVHLRFLCNSEPERLQLQSGLFGGTGHSYQLHVHATRGANSDDVTLTRRNNKAAIDLARSTPAGDTPVWLVLTIAAIALLLAAVILFVLTRQRQRQRQR